MLNPLKKNNKKRQQKRKTNTVAAGFVANGFNGLPDWNLNWAGYE